MRLSPSDILPDDHAQAVLVGRVWIDGAAGAIAGPRVVRVSGADLIDLSALAPTMSDLFDLPDCAQRVCSHRGSALGRLDDALEKDRLLAPCDLQAIKAAGVTFSASAVERVIEERARGNPQQASALRTELEAALGGPLADIEPGSTEAASAKEVLCRNGQWSQYLEVAIGPDPEIFTKAQPMSAVGCGAQIGIHPRSKWNNPEAEVVLAISSRGAIVGATLGNDVNLRDFEGRSALLLGMAKDNNASCAIGPFVRLFDQNFTLDDVQRAAVELVIEGDDGFRLSGRGTMTAITRTPASLVAAASGSEHQYPDGFFLFLGAAYVPSADRREPGYGFTHDDGDRVTVSSARIGALHNRVTTSDRAPPWTYGSRALMQSLAARGLLQPPNLR